MALHDGLEVALQLVGCALHPVEFLAYRGQFLTRCGVPPLCHGDQLRQLGHLSGGELSAGARLGELSCEGGFLLVDLRDPHLDRLRRASDALGLDELLDGVDLPFALNARLLQREPLNLEPGDHLVNDSVEQLESAGALGSDERVVASGG